MPELLIKSSIIMYTLKSLVLGRQRQMASEFKAVQPTQVVTGQPRLHIETLAQKLN